MVEPLYSSEESTIFYYFSVKDRIIPSQMEISAIFHQSRMQRNLSQFLHHVFFQLDHPLM